MSQYGTPFWVSTCSIEFLASAKFGVFGATIPYFICELTLRGTDLSGKTVVAPWFRSEAQRCQEP